MINFALNRKHLLATVLLSFLAIGCDSSSSDENNSANGNANGFLTGDIWYQGPSRATYRFNLETGTSTRLVGSQVYPTRDGTQYVDLDPDVQFVSALGSGCGESFSVAEVSVRDTRTQEVITSFATQEPLTYPVKASPDLSRFLSLSNSHPCDQELGDPRNITMYSSTGEVLLRFTSNFIAFDWLHDGRAAVLKSVGGRSFELWTETAPGSLEFFQTSWTFLDDIDFIAVQGLKSNHDGTKFMFEIVQDRSNVNTINFRHSQVVFVDIVAGSVSTVFIGNEPDGSLKATEPVFSPDGNWILITQDWFTGGSITEDSVFLLPRSGVSYVVPVNSSDDLLLPPVQTTDTIRAVMSRPRSTGTLQAARINPLGGQVWTPTVR